MTYSETVNKSDEGSSDIFVIVDESDGQDRIA